MPLVTSERRQRARGLVPRLEQQGGPLAALIALLEQGPTTIRDVAARAGLPVPLVQAMAEHLARRGRLVPARGPGANMQASPEPARTPACVLCPIRGSPACPVRPPEASWDGAGAGCPATPQAVRGWILAARAGAAGGR